MAKTHNCMILNIKTCFDKKVTFSFGASVIVKQLSLLLNICTFKMKSRLKQFQSSRMASKHAQLQIFIQANITVGKN